MSPGRVDYPREVPAAIVFLSLEPLLGPMTTLELSGINWLVVGRESGRSARPIAVG